MDGTTEEEEHRNPFLSSSLPSFQFRSEVSKAIWDEKLGLGEVVEKKGGSWTSTGVTRNGGKLYCNIEEIIFYMERGALLLLDSKNKVLDLKYMYTKLEGYGCNCESLEAYRHLRSLGYIIKRHDVTWTMKDAPIVEMVRAREINRMRLDFDVYLPNGRFRKTSPGDPNFILCLVSGKPPSTSEIEGLEEKCNGVPLKFCHVDNGRVSIFSFEKSNLELLP